MDSRYLVVELERDLPKLAKADLDSAEAAVALAAIGKLAQWNRVVAVFAEDDFRRLEPNRDTTAFTVGPTVSYVALDADYFTVAHELAHTMPWDWSDRQMRALFNFSYHNEAEPITGVGRGFDVRYRHLMGEGTHAVMGSTGWEDKQDRISWLLKPLTHDNSPSTIAGKWIAQGTYWHLLDFLSTPIPDPDLLLVRGLIAHPRHTSGYRAEFRPFYEFTSIADPAGAASGDFEIVLRGAGGTILGRYPFTPVWTPEDLHRTLPVAAFSCAVPNRPGIAEVELVGRSGNLARQQVSPRPPQVRIVFPTPAASLKVHDHRVRIEWTASSPFGLPAFLGLLFTRWRQLLVRQGF